MKSDEITQDELREVIIQMAAKWPSQRELAKHLEISDALMTGILDGTRPISKRVAQRLGYRRIVKYRKDGSIG